MKCGYATADARMDCDVKYVVRRGFMQEYVFWTQNNSILTFRPPVSPELCHFGKYEYV